MEEIIEIDVNRIKPNKFQPRQKFNEEEIKELAGSINSVGQINPIQVRKIEGDAKYDYELINGERRLRAHKLINKPKIKAIVKDIDDEHSKAESIIENIQRSDLTTMERARAIAELEKIYSVIEISKLIGLSESRVRNFLDLMQLENKELADEVEKGEISEHHFRVIKKIGNKEEREKVLKKVKAESINSQQTERLIKIIAEVPKEVADAVLSNIIDIDTAENIAKIKETKNRKLAIKSHKRLKAIEKNIEKKIIKNQTGNKKLIMAKNIINNFRATSVISVKETKRAMNTLLTCAKYIKYFDEQQKEKLKHYIELWVVSLQNSLDIAEKIKVEK
jgi:ParB family chromosome partitioning protein